MNEERSIWQSEEPYEVPSIVCLLLILFIGSMLAWASPKLTTPALVAGGAVLAVLSGILLTLFVLSSPKRQP